MFNEIKEWYKEWKIQFWLLIISISAFIGVIIRG